MLLGLIQYHFKNMKNLKYQFEYFCSPIWVQEGDAENAIYKNLNVDELSISDPLKMEINDLENIYQSTYNDEYPPSSIQFSKRDGYQFVTRILGSARLLEKEIAGEYNLIFDHVFWESRLLQYLS